MTVPLCPVTGEPAVRRIQSIRSRFLVDLWRYGAGVDARPSFGSQDRFGLWESPTGLHFFDPMMEGDGEFYSAFYARIIQRKLWADHYARPEFEVAARSIRPGDRVLDVGCGSASFRHVIPHARYVGLDPHFAQRSGIEEVSDQTLGEHLVEQAGRYDVVCAFQVLEHLKSPAALFADMVRAARPGGLVIVGVPQIPSALTRTPNSFANAPPHHLTWWTKPALAALAQRHGAMAINIEQVPWGKDDSLLYWMERCSPIRCKDVYFRNRLHWHAAALLGYFGGRIVHAVRKAPKTTDEGSGLLMVAQRQ